MATPCDKGGCNSPAAFLVTIREPHGIPSRTFHFCRVHATTSQDMVRRYHIDAVFTYLGRRVPAASAVQVATAAVDVRRAARALAILGEAT